jgi:hypothetical protein
METDNLIYSKKEKLYKEKVDFISWDIIKELDPIVRITSKNNKDFSSINLNYNIEVRDIEKNEDRVNLIKNKFDEILEQYNKFKKEIFEND